MDTKVVPHERRNLRGGHRPQRRGRVCLPGHVCHVTVATRERQPHFANFHVACTAVRAFVDPAMRGDARLLAWVLMPDHVHWLLQAGQCLPVETVVARMKSATGVQVNRTLSCAGALWEPAFHDRALRRENDLAAVARHIVATPLRAGLVDDIRDYPFWDSAWLPDIDASLQTPADGPPPAPLSPW